MRRLRFALCALVVLPALAACQPAAPPRPDIPIWNLAGPDTAADPTTFTYGSGTDQHFLACDWDGNGTDTPAIVVNGAWRIRNSATAGPSEVRFAYGNAGDTAICGDWDGNGTDTPGLWRDGVWKLRNANSAGAPDITFNYGIRGDRPVVGDWDGNRTDTAGYRRGTEFSLRNSNSAGTPTSKFVFGPSGGVPVAGSWSGGARSEVGVRSSNQFLLRRQGLLSASTTTVTFGSSTGRPLIGRWTARGGPDQFGVVTIEAAAAHDTKGTLTDVHATATTARVQGAVSDIDTTGPIAVEVTVDGKASATVQTKARVSRSATALYNVTVAAPKSAKQICVTAIGVGAGAGRSTLGCRSIAVPPASDRYGFIIADARGRPTRFNPCAPVHYVINPAGIPAGFGPDIHEAFKRASAATGITFIYDGHTTETASDGRPAYLPARYPGRWAPILVAYPNPAGLKAFGQPADAVGGPTGLSGSPMQTRSGIVYFNRSALWKFHAGFNGRLSHGTVVLHEIGHVLGLGHVKVNGEVMGPNNTYVGNWGAGDRAGLKWLGSAQGCLSASKPG